MDFESEIFLRSKNKLKYIDERMLKCDLKKYV